MQPEDEELRREAERVFRHEAINYLTFTTLEHSIAESYRLWDASEGVPADLIDELLEEPSEPSRRLAIDYDELTGEPRGVVEVEREVQEMGTAGTSMSMHRAPSHENRGIKGSTSNIPFIPGGFDEELENVIRFARDTAAADAEDAGYLTYEDLLTQVPGLPRAATFAKTTTDAGKGPAKKEERKPDERKEVPKEFDIDTADIFELLDYAAASGGAGQKEEEEDKGKEEEEEDGDGAVDLPEEVETVIKMATVVREEPHIPKAREEFEYAYNIPTYADIPEYEKIFPKMAKKYPFPLDPFQQAAVVCMERGESVFVAAHTSAGKTVVAEYAIALCKAHKTRTIYTSPIKALSNQKYRDFKMTFEDVGLVTGDIQIAPEAFCLIMTTEILRSMLYNGSEVIRELEWVVFDEVHYINDADRGHVWEEVLIMLPAHVGIIMLSATVPNCIEFADWVGRIKNRRLAVVSTQKRPVPLEHYLYTGQDGKTKKDLFKVVDKDNQFSFVEYKKAANAKAGITPAPGTQPPPGAPGARGAPPQGNQRGAFNQRGGGGPQRGGGQQRGGQGNAGGGGGRGRGVGRGGGSGGGGHGRNDKNIYINLVDHLRSIDKLPMVCFVFSRKRCDDNAQLLRSVDLTTAVEKSHIVSFFTQCISRLKGTDKDLPQVVTMRELCTRGFAVHHSGILPILKEVVELLFQKGYVKILFATETFAMGVNMPARTVVFDSLSKHDGTSLRLLQPGEYIQMAGRAGRRGLDSTGTVIVVCKGESVPESGELQTVMKGQAAKLESKFRVTYSMLLNLLRAEHLRIEDMLQRSYVESLSLRKGGERKTELEQVRLSLSSLRRVECPVCEPEEAIAVYHRALVDYLCWRAILWSKWRGVPAVDKLFAQGRLLILTSAQHALMNRLVVLVKEESRGNERTLQESERQFIENSALVNGALRYGLEGVAPVERTDGGRRFKIKSGIPHSAIVSVVGKSVRIDVGDLFAEAKRRELPRFRDEPLGAKSAQLVQEVDQLAEEYAAGSAPIVVPGRDVQVTEVSLYEETQMVYRKRDELLSPACFPARHCALINEHMALVRESEWIKQRIARLEFELSADSLTLSQEYRDKIEILKLLDYVDNSNMVTFKGRVACEIHHQELLITELMLDTKLHGRDAAEIAALLSATTCQYKKGDGIKWEEGSALIQLKDDVVTVLQRLEQKVKASGLQINDGYEEVRFDLMDVVYNWAKGMPFAEIMQLTEAQEGLIVRCIQRLGEVAKDVRNAARIVGDPALQEKMEQVQTAIKRDIVFAASLYTTV